MNKKYTHIFFDLDNTLWNFEINSRNAMLSVFHYLNLDSSSDFDLFFKIYTKHNRALWESYRKNEVVKKDLTRLRFQNTFDELAITGIDANEMNELYLFEMPKQKALNEGVIEVLTYLKKKKYHLNIITNGFKEVQHNKIESSGLKPYFDKIFISEEVKSPKPARAIFEYAVKSSNAKKTNSIMIGDDWDVDVMGAVNYGIDAVHYNEAAHNSENLNQLLTYKSRIYSVESMSQLYSYL
ncbi:MAG TPA: YjjG family noncanonical pyrimidine nucleotidase [Draconibacterium sp.]|nr:YjjG family noncanonical pyrimidine nucleotidase [Draconibacterium sp.]